MHHAVGWCADEQNADRDCRQVLLELDAPVHRDERIISVSIRRRSSPFVMPVQPRWTTVSTLWPLSAAARSTGSCSSRRTRTSQQRSAGEVERRDRLVAFDGRELAEELVQGFAAFQIVKQRLDRHAGADKHRRAPEDVRVAVCDIAWPCHAASVYTRSNRAYDSGIRPTAFGGG